MLKANVTRIVFGIIATAVAVTLAFVGRTTDVTSGKYKGDTAKKINDRVVYDNSAEQYKDTAWKDFKTDETEVYVFNAGYQSYHGEGDYYVGKKLLTGDAAKKLLYELSLATATEEIAPAVATTAQTGEALYGTKWIQTKNKKYRLPKDSNELHEVQDYHGEGKVLKASENLRLLIDLLYKYDQDKDYFYGEYLEGVLTVQKEFDGSVDDSLIVTDFFIEQKSNRNFAGYMKLLYTPTKKAGDYTVNYLIKYSDDHYGNWDHITVTTQKGKSYEITIPISATRGYFDMIVYNKGFEYSFYMHSH